MFEVENNKPICHLKYKRNATVMKYIRVLLLSLQGNAYMYKSNTVDYIKISCLFPNLIVKY